MKKKGSSYIYIWIWLYNHLRHKTAEKYETKCDWLFRFDDDDNNMGYKCILSTTWTWMGQLNTYNRIYCKQKECNQHTVLTVWCLLWSRRCQIGAIYTVSCIGYALCLEWFNEVTQIHLNQSLSVLKGDVANTDLVSRTENLNVSSQANTLPI